jgi:hypothetical protein
MLCLRALFHTASPVKGLSGEGNIEQTY